MSGKFCIPSEQILQLDIIGQGIIIIISLVVHLSNLVISGEFGVVYRARLGPRGRFSRVVAVKTLRGLWSKRKLTY